MHALAGAAPLTRCAHLPSLARSRVTSHAAGRSSPPTLDDAFSVLDTRRLQSARVRNDDTEHTLPPFQSDLENEQHASGSMKKPADSLPRPPKTHSVMAVIGVATDTPLTPPSFSALPLNPIDPSSAAVAAAIAASPAMRWVAAAAACVFASALSAFLLACIPTLRAIANAADEIADLAASIREEVPDTLAAVRVSGMELTDCLEEVGELTHDVGSGLKGTGKAVLYTVDTAGAIGKAIGSRVRQLAPEVARVQQRATPAVKRAIAGASASMDEFGKKSDETLRQNASTDEYSEPVVAAAARATKNGVRYARGAIRAADVARRVGRAVKTVRSVADAGRDEASKTDAEER